MSKKNSSIEKMREEMGDAPKVQLNLGPSNPEFSMSSNAIFADKTKEFGLMGQKAQRLYSVDINRDDYTDLVLIEENFSTPKFYVFNSKTMSFELIPNPFAEVVRGSYLVFADFDHDEVLDIVVGHLNQKTEITQFPLRIYRGILNENEIKYIKAFEFQTLPLPTSSVALLDYNLDGKLDIYLANWFSDHMTRPIGIPDMLYKGNGFSFENVSYLLKDEDDYNKNLKVYPNATPTMGVTVCDVDQNGFPDILTSNSNGFYNKLWQNNEGSEFFEIGDATGFAADKEGAREAKQGGHSFYSLCGDYNNDGLIDIVIGNMFSTSDPEFRDKSAVLTGAGIQPLKFIRSEFYTTKKVDFWVERDERGLWIDYNVDGLQDLLVLNSGFPPQTRLVLFNQKSDHEYVDVASELGIDIANPSGAVTVDINRDGLMDVIVGQSTLRSKDSKGRLYVFLNQFKRNRESTFRFHLQGREANSGGISSSIYLNTNKNRHYANVIYSYGPLPSQNEEGVYMAIGEEIPSEVEVRWAFSKEDRLGRKAPLISRYSLKKFFKKGTHHVFNLCDDGRLLIAPNNCYRH